MVLLKYYINLQIVLLNDKNIISILWLIDLSKIHYSRRQYAKIKIIKLGRIFINNQMLYDRDIGDTCRIDIVCSGAKICWFIFKHNWIYKWRIESYIYIRNVVLHQKDERRQTNNQINFCRTFIRSVEPNNICYFEQGICVQYDDIIWHFICFDCISNCCYHNQSNS